MEKFIKLTRPKIKTIFYECNQAYFDNKVRIPAKFELYTPNENIAAWVRVSWDKNKGYFITHLHISSAINWTEENLRKTILHEMIHLELNSHLKRRPWWKRWLTKQHDKKFVTRMNELNKKYGLHITVDAPHLKPYLK